MTLLCHSRFPDRYETQHVLLWIMNCLQSLGLPVPRGSSCLFVQDIKLLLTKLINSKHTHEIVIDKGNEEDKGCTV